MPVVVVAAVGSRGDVQPSLVLAAALRRRGHQVYAATEERLRPLVDSFGMAWRRLEGDSAGLLIEPAAQAAVRSRNFFTLMRLQKQWDARFDKLEVLRSYERALAGADIIVASALCLTPCLCVAEAQGARLAALLPGPTWPTAEFPLWALGVPCHCLNQWTYRLAFAALWAQERPHVDAWRQTLGLAPMGKEGPLQAFTRWQTPVLIAASRLACGRKGAIPSDYPHHVVVGGFLTASAHQDSLAPAQPSSEAGPRRAVEVPEGVRAFVRDAHSQPIVYVGFGSMPATQSTVLRLARTIASTLNCRVVVASGWSRADAEDEERAAQDVLAAADRSVHVVGSVPHTWLFPLCAAVVHHCGVGTMAAGLLAGVPQVPVAFMLDQPHNAKLLTHLGVAPCAFSWCERLPVEKVAAAAGAILNEGGNGPVCAAARRAKAVVQAESADAIPRFVAAIEAATVPGVAHASAPADSQGAGVPWFRRAQGRSRLAVARGRSIGEGYQTLDEHNQ